MTFQRRSLSAPDTLGERLRQLREEKGLTGEELGKKLSIAPKYIKALEEGRYQDTPGLVYARNFVRQYAAAMSLPVDAALARFEEEYKIVHGRRKESPRLVQRANTEFPWYIRHSRFLFSTVAIILIGVYIVWQVLHLLQPPLLEITNPAQDVATSAATIVVTGKTEPEAQVRINNQQTQVSDDGTFSEEVELQAGLNVLKITAVRKYSRTAVIERRVLVEQGR